MLDCSGRSLLHDGPRWLFYSAWICKLSSQNIALLASQQQAMSALQTRSRMSGIGGGRARVGRGGGVGGGLEGLREEEGKGRPCDIKS